MPKTNPFAGVKLTEQTPLKTAGRDQRLFTSSPIQAPPEPTEKEGTREVGKEGSREIGKETSLPVKRGANEDKRIFDLNQSPYRKDSFLFTAEEFEALEDLKLELRRKFDFRATKNDLARCAIQNLIEDYQEHGADSVVVKGLTKKRIR